MSCSLMNMKNLNRVTLLRMMALLMIAGHAIGCVTPVERSRGDDLSQLNHSRDADRKAFENEDVSWYAKYHVNRGSYLHSPLPRLYRIVLFPKPAVSQCDSTGPVVDRAVIMGVDGYAARQLGVHQEGQEGGIATYPRSAFTAIPPENMVAEYIRRLNEVIVSWGNETDYRSVEYTYKHVKDAIRVEVLIHSKDFEEYKCTYKLGPGESLMVVDYEEHIVDREKLYQDFIKGIVE